MHFFMDPGTDILAKLRKISIPHFSFYKVEVFRGVHYMDLLK